MIYPIILHHDTSKKYTDTLISRIDRQYSIIDSSQLQTQFTDSFNLGIVKGLIKTKDTKFTHIMICNNDIVLNEGYLEELDRMVKGKSGIFSPACNSPHQKVMSPIGKKEIREVPWIEFVAPIFSRDVLIKTGLLDNMMPRGWGVELDYCYRAKNKGFKTRLCQGVAIYHHGHKSQESHEDYSHFANIEMNDRLREKYGDNWGEILKYPQW